MHLLATKTVHLYLPSKCARNLVQGGAGPHDGDAHSDRQYADDRRDLGAADASSGHVDPEVAQAREQDGHRDVERGPDEGHEVAEEGHRARRHHRAGEHGGADGPWGGRPGRRATASPLSPP